MFIDENFRIDQKEYDIIVNFVYRVYILIFQSLIFH